MNLRTKQAKMYEMTRVTSHLQPIQRHAQKHKHITQRRNANMSKPKLAVHLVLQSTHDIPSDMRFIPQ
jgi:hypothetical protein